MKIFLMLFCPLSLAGRAAKLSSLGSTPPESFLSMQSRNVRFLGGPGAAPWAGVRGWARA